MAEIVAPTVLFIASGAEPGRRAASTAKKGIGDWIVETIE